MSINVVISSLILLFLVCGSIWARYLENKIWNHGACSCENGKVGEEGDDMRKIKFKLFKDGKLQGIVELKPGSIIDAAYGWDTAYEYIGLKDKDNVEIYEGDIVRVWYNMNNCQGKQVAVIEWDRYRWKISLIQDRGYSCSPITSYPQLKVIGNIYENGNLLLESTT